MAHLWAVCYCLGDGKQSIKDRWAF